MSRGPQHTLEEVISAVERGHTIKGTAQVLGCRTRVIRGYAKRWASVQEALEAERNDIVDLAEIGLRKHVLDSQPWAIAYALSTLGKDRGYTKRSELTGKDGDDIGVRIKAVDYRSATAPLAPGSVEDSPAPGEG
jgi:hypothetical protein